MSTKLSSPSITTAPTADTLSHLSEPAPTISQDLSNRSDDEEPHSPHLSSNRPTSRTLLNTLAQNGKDKDKDRNTKAASSSARLDPLSTVCLICTISPLLQFLLTVAQQIYLRTNSNTEPTIAQRLRSAGRPDSPNPDALDRKPHDTSIPPNSLSESRDKK